LWLRSSAFFLWPKAIFTVARNNARGIRAVTTRWADGHIDGERQGVEKMALGQERAVFF
jgi:hypothetical protein